MKQHHNSCWWKQRSCLSLSLSLQFGLLVITCFSCALLLGGTNKVKEDLYQYIPFSTQILEILLLPRCKKYIYKWNNRLYVLYLYRYAWWLCRYDEFQTSQTPASRRPKINSLYDVFVAICVSIHLFKICNLFFHASTGCKVDMCCSDTFLSAPTSHRLWNMQLVQDD